VAGSADPNRTLSGTLWHAIAPTDSDARMLETWASMMTPAERRVLHATLLLADRRVTPLQLVNGYAKVLGIPSNLRMLAPAKTELSTAPCARCSKPINRATGGKGRMPSLCVPCATATRRETTALHTRDYRARRGSTDGPSAA
jgi:hypothetical protein